MVSINEKFDLTTLDNSTLNEESEEVIVYLAGYIALNIHSVVEATAHIFFCEGEDSEYAQVTCTAVLKTLTQVLFDNVCLSFVSYKEVIQKVAFTVELLQRKS